MFQMFLGFCFKFVVISKHSLSIDKRLWLVSELKGDLDNLFSTETHLSCSTKCFFRQNFINCFLRSTDESKHDELNPPMSSLTFSNTTTLTVLYLFILCTNSSLLTEHNFRFFHSRSRETMTSCFPTYLLRKSPSSAARALLSNILTSLIYGITYSKNSEYSWK